MNGLFFSTGRAARALGVTQAQIRALCQSNAIAAEVTDGGQWRLPRAEVERLKRDGLPPVALPLPADTSQPSQGKARYGHPALLAEPSGEVVAGAEAVAIAESLLKKRKLELELEEVEDHFREREQQGAEHQATEEQQERLRLAEEQAQRERTEWLRTWEQHALDNAPRDLPAELRLQLHQAVRARLEGLNPMPSRDVTRRLVQSEIDKVAQPWERKKQIANAVEEAADSLPYEIKGWPWRPSEWDIRAREAAAKAIGELRSGATSPEMRTVGIQAVKGVVAQYEAQKTAQQDAEMRQDVIRWASLPTGLTDEGKEMARAAIAEALAKLPPGTPRRKLEQARDEALAPFRAAVERYEREQAQRVAEERRKQEDHATRQSILTWASWRLPYDFPDEHKEAALAAVPRAIAELPEGTPKPQLEQARDQALQPFLNAHAQRKRKAQLIEDGLRGILAYLLKLSQTWDFGAKTPSTLEAEIRGQVRNQLLKQVSGTESPEEVEKLLHRLVRETVGIQRRRVYVERTG